MQQTCEIVRLLHVIWTLDFKKENITKKVQHNCMHYHGSQLMPGKKKKILSGGRHNEVATARYILYLPKPSHSKLQLLSSQYSQAKKDPLTPKNL